MALATAAALALAGPPGARAAGPTPEEAAAQLCQQAKVMFGSQFEVLFGSQAGCEAKTLPIVNAAIAKCGDDQACLQSEIQRELMELALGGGGENVATTQILAQACSQLQAKLGKRFAKAFGSVAGCKEKIKPDIDKLIADAAVKCKASADPGSCITQTAASAEAAFVAKYATGFSADVIAGEVADEVCGRLQTELGDRFAKKYGSLDGCKAQIAEKVAPLAKDAAAKCQSAANPEACITEQIDATTGTLSEALGLAPSADEIAAEAADQICARLQTELGGDRFAKKYGSLDRCKTQTLAKITPYVRDQVARCGKATDRGVCAAEVAAGANEKLAATLGLGPDLDDITGEIAAEVCARLKSELGADRFAKEYKTADRCLTTVSQFARGFSADAIARCSAAADRGACTKTAMEAGAAKVAETYGPGPAETEIVKEIVEQACTRLKADLQPQEWASKFPNDTCEGVVGRGVASDVHGAVARCSKVTDQGACITTAVQDVQTRLIAAWAGPNVDQVADQVMQEACKRLSAQLGAAEFAARIGDVRACGALVYKDGRALAEAAVKECKAAADKRACSERKIAEGEQALTKKLVAGPSVKELALKTMQETCDRLKAEVGARAAATVDCPRLIGGPVEDAARAAVAACVDKTPFDKGACIEARLRGAQAGFEATFRAGVKFRDADVEAVVAQAAKRGCDEAVAQRGARAPSDCNAKAQNYIRDLVYDFFQKCKGDQTCVRGKVEDEGMRYLRYQLSDGQYAVTADQATFKVIDSLLWGTCGQEALAARVSGGVAGRNAWEKAFHAEKYGGAGTMACIKTFEPTIAPKVKSTVTACWAKPREDQRYDCIDATLQPVGKDLLKAIRAIFPPLPAKK